LAALEENTHASYIVSAYLPPDLEQRLIQEAKRQGLPGDAYTLQLLDTHLPFND
jgi:hypothetical protein